MHRSPVSYQGTTFDDRSGLNNLRLLIPGVEKVINLLRCLQQAGPAHLGFPSLLG
jgi:hypothetical protein